MTNWYLKSGLWVTFFLNKSDDNFLISLVPFPFQKTYFMGLFGSKKEGFLCVGHFVPSPKYAFIRRDFH